MNEHDEDYGERTAAVESAIGGMTYNDFELDGFWNGANAKPGPVRHVAGDREQFLADIERTRGRQRARLNTMQNNRWLLAYSWPEEMMLVDEWCDESISYLSAREDSGDEG
jgi:hypothetical protein